MTSSPAHLRRRLQLIVITDRAGAAPRDVLGVVEAALQAGAPAIQLRDKTTPAAQLFDTARELRSLTNAHGALMFVNDRLDVALAAAADGVHLGPDDVPVAAARRAVPSAFLVGFSTDEPTAARRAVDDGADYIGCGTVYPTSSKKGVGEVIGLSGLRAVVEAVSVPVIGIGGITPTRAEEVAAVGAAGVAVIGAVMGANDPGGVVEALLAPFLPSI